MAALPKRVFPSNDSNLEQAERPSSRCHTVHGLRFRLFEQFQAVNKKQQSVSPRHNKRIHWHAFGGHSRNVMQTSNEMPNER